MVDHTARDHEVVSSMLGFLRLLSFFYFFTSSKECLNKVPATISDMKAVWKRIPSCATWSEIGSLCTESFLYFNLLEGILKLGTAILVFLAVLVIKLCSSLHCRVHILPRFLVDIVPKQGFELLTGFNRCFWQLSLTAEGTHCNCKFMQHYKDFVRKKTSLVTF